jgi:CHAT domain-containing protein
MQYKGVRVTRGSRNRFSVAGLWHIIVGCTVLLSLWAFAAPAPANPKKPTSRDLPAASCKGSSIQHRTAQYYNGLSFGKFDQLEADIATMELLYNYCDWLKGARPKPIDLGDLDVFLKIADSSKDGPILIYFLIRAICERPSNIPGGQAFRTALLSLLKNERPKSLNSLKTYLLNDTIFSTVEEIGGKTLGQLALYMETYNSVRRLDPPSSKAKNEEKAAYSAMSLRSAAYASAAYSEIALQYLTVALNKALMEGEGVELSNPAIFIAMDKLDLFCRQVQELDKSPSRPGAYKRGANVSRSQCVFFEMQIAFMTGDTKKTASLASEWLDHYAAQEDIPKKWETVWKSHWYRAWASGTSGHMDLALKEFERAFEAVLHVTFTDPGRGKFKGTADAFQNAEITADAGRPQDLPYLFFCQWLHLLEESKASPEKMLELIERARLFEGSSSYITATFGKGKRLLEKLPGAFSEEEAPDAKSMEVRSLLNRRIAGLRYDAFAPNTAVYFFNEWSSKVFIILRTPSQWIVRTQKVSLSDLTENGKPAVVAQGRSWRAENPVEPLSTKGLQFHYSLLIEPVKNDLTAGATFYAVPSMYLNAVPFAALVPPEGGRLIDRFAFAYHPSLTAVNFQETRPSPDGGLLIVHSPNAADSETFPKSGLKHAPGEAKGIMALTPGGAVAELAGNAATKANLKQKLASARALHVIAHGFALAGDPLSGGIVLSPDGDDKGILSFREMMEWTPGLKLMMLSACETGHVRKEGVFLSGAPGLVTLGIADTIGISLWKLSDDTGSLLHRAFYLYLQQGKGAAEALRLAQLDVIKIYTDSEVELWAPVVLYTARQGTR